MKNINCINISNLYPPLDVLISLGEKLVYTCAWNRWNERVSIGVRGNALVIDIARRNKWVFNTSGGDPVTQIFSKKVRKISVKYTVHTVGLLLQYTYEQKKGTTLKSYNYLEMVLDFNYLFFYLKRHFSFQI